MAILLFEPETSKLSEYELSELVPVMVKCLQNKVGKDNAVSNSFMVEKMQGPYAFCGEASDGEMALAIEELRLDE